MREQGSIDLKCRLCHLHHPAKPTGMVPKDFLCGSVSRRGNWMKLPRNHYGVTPMKVQEEIRVCMDIGCKQHHVGIGLSNGQLLESFDMMHTTTGIDDFFKKIDTYKQSYKLPVVIAMEAYNGYARPIDQYALDKGYRVYNVNNNKLAQFKKVFAGPAKSDAIDTKKMFELFCLDDHLYLSKNVLQEVHKEPEVNNKLKRLTRRRSALVKEKVVTINRMQADIESVSPGLLKITGSADNLWFLNFLTARDALSKLARIKDKGLLEISKVGKRYLEPIKEWQKVASFSPETQWVGDMIIQDAKRLLVLKKEIARLEKMIDELNEDSEIARRIKTIVGFGTVTSAVLAGEIGTLARFNSESGLALYTGMAVLDNSSGGYTGSKKYIHVNRACKAALMVAVARHINHCPESKKYYDKKRAEGKKHNQAVRSLGRHMIRVIWSMLKNNRDYEIRTAEED